MDNFHKQQGLVLKSIDFRDRQKILTLFTPAKGIVSLIVKGITRKKSNLLTLTTPFTVAEYLYRVGRTDLYTFIDATILETNHHLRTSLETLDAATAINRALLETQYPEKEASSLFRLTLVYLSALKDHDPTTILSSFYLKLLLHEGLLSTTHPHPLFSHQEWDHLAHLATARTFDALKKKPATPSLASKIKTLFTEALNNCFARPSFCERGDSNPQEVSLTTPSR